MTSIFDQGVDFASEIGANGRSIPHRWGNPQPVTLTAPLRIFPQNGVFFASIS
jgi:hypothetical protein